jgi:Asp-tRNA(Asn)/Glu-tRNA(Gln) amidotransferase B subunit
MTEETLYRHQIKVGSRQLELASDNFVGDSVLSEDYEEQLRESQARLQKLQAEQQELERLARDLEELNAQKKIFFSSQVEISEKLSNAVTLMDRELLAMRTELHELEQCRHLFDNRLKKIAKYDPETWTRENLKANLDKAITAIDEASDEYEEAARHFSTMRSGEIFGTSKRRSPLVRSMDHSEFLAQLKNGFAFNLPIVSIAVIAMIIYLIR